MDIDKSSLSIDCGNALKLLVKYSPVPFAIFDRNMRFLLANSRWIEQFRLEKDQIVGRCFDDTFPDIWFHLKEVHQQCMANAAERCEEYAFLCDDGRSLWVSWEVRPWFDDDGDIGGLIVFSEDITERKENELRLRESEENFRAMVEDSPLPVIVTCADNDAIVYANRLATGLFHFPGSTKGLCARDFYVNPDDYELVVEEIAREGYIKDWEIQLKTYDGAPIWTSIAVQSIVYNGDEAWKTVIKDISERKQTEELLMEAERSAEFGTYSFDLTGGIWTCSPVLENIFGIDSYFRRDLDGWLQLVHPDQREEMKAYLENDVLSKLQTFDREYRIVRPSDGTERWVRGRGTLRLDQDGRPYLLFGSVQDITAYKTTLARSEMFHQVIDQAGEAILITNNQGDIEYVNPAFTRITGYAESEVIGQNPRILNSGNQDGDFYRGMWEDITNGGVWQGRIVDRRKDGSFYPCLLTISAMHNEAGEIKNFIGIQQDLKEYEEMEKQFFQAQKMEAIGILVGGIAHDFNNTLAGITGNLYMARKDAAASPKLMQRLKSIEVLSFRAADMIQQLLAFSRKEEVQMRPMSIAPFLNEAIKLHRVSLPENIRLKYESQSKNMIVRGDAGILQQALMNLINNARDAVHDVPRPVINISLDLFEADVAFHKKHPRIDTRDFACLRVRDNGSGIREEVLVHIFEPFFTTKEANRGTGLGLAMVYGAVQNHGGVIEVASIEGEGTEFIIYLPLMKSPKLEKVSENAEDDVALAGHGEWILLADDSESVLATTKEVLEGLNYQVMTASDGSMAVDVYREHQHEIGLSILDMMMPKLDGLEAYRSIREIDPRAKALFASGYDFVESKEKIPDVSSGMFVSKPYAIVELSRLIRRALEEG